MFSKFSVRKPYTVIVGVILVIILGIVSFSKMTTDLLPSMELPYALVMTTYQGASPEEVETTVTKPVEQAMATISNIKQVASSPVRICPLSIWSLKAMPIWIRQLLICGKSWI